MAMPTGEPAEQLRGRRAGGTPRIEPRPGTLLGAAVAAALLLTGMVTAARQPTAMGAVAPEATGPARGGPPEPPAVVLRLADGRAVPGALGTYTWGTDGGLVHADAFAVVVPVEPVEVAAGARVRVDASALGTPIRVTYTLYRVGRDTLERRSPTARAVSPGACRLARGEWPAAPVVPVVLDLSPGRYALDVTVDLEGGRDAAHGFYLRVTRSGAGTPPPEAGATPAGGDGTPDAAAPAVLEATAASPCAATPATE